MGIMDKMGWDFFQHPLSLTPTLTPSLKLWSTYRKLWSTYRKLQRAGRELRG